MQTLRRAQCLLRRSKVLRLTSLLVCDLRYVIEDFRGVQSAFGSFALCEGNWRWLKIVEQNRCKNRCELNLQQRLTESLTKGTERHRCSWTQIIRLNKALPVSLMVSRCYQDASTLLLSLKNKKAKKKSDSTSTVTFECNFIWIKSICFYSLLIFKLDRLREMRACLKRTSSNLVIPSLNV